MVVTCTNAERSLSDTEIREVLAEGFGQLDLTGKRVLIVIPDGTRTAPIGLFFGLLGDILGSKVEALDYLIALGTHPPMDDAAKGRLLETTVVDGMAGSSRIFNHRWEAPDTFATLGTIPAAEVAAETDGMMEMDIVVRLNQLVGDEDGNTLLRPHSGLRAGLSPRGRRVSPEATSTSSRASPVEEVIDATHWVGALVTSQSIIGVRETPVRRLIDRAASFIPTPRSLIALVMHGHDLHGIFMGGMEEAWRPATELSAELDIVWVDQPFKRVLSVMPEMYDDIWTGAKGMYKLEPAIADGGEVVIYAPHITEVSYVHGHHLDQIGYHVRDYFTAQWEKFKHIPWGVLAHSTHLRGHGSFVDGVEKPRIRSPSPPAFPVSGARRLASDTSTRRRWTPKSGRTGRTRASCWCRRAGEQLYRLKNQDHGIEGGAMTEKKADLGLIGLAVMGQNLVLNMNDHGFKVAVLQPDRVEGGRVSRRAMPRAPRSSAPTRSRNWSTRSAKPRRVMLAGQGGPTGGRFHRAPDSRSWTRATSSSTAATPTTTTPSGAPKYVESKGLLYIGTGVSGGEEGARKGPSIMPGGSPAAWPHVKPIFQAVSAKVEDGSPCCEWVGENGAGHFVKMVHNGIEYGDMQLICEAYQLMKEGLGLDHDRMHEVFAEWNEGELDSYLIEITRDILGFSDEDGEPIVEKILDTAGQKGTGKWTAMSALEMGIPLTLIAEAVLARFLSALKDERVAAEKVLSGPDATFDGDVEAFIDDLRQALYASKIVSYAQGYMLMRAAAERVRLEPQQRRHRPDVAGRLHHPLGLPRQDQRGIRHTTRICRNLLLDPYFQGRGPERPGGLAAGGGKGGRIWACRCRPCRAGSAFFDGYRHGRLPANLLQAQRDYFGAHTYERVDRPRGEFFHTDWTGHGGDVTARTYQA